MEREAVGETPILILFPAALAIGLTTAHSLDINPISIAPVAINCSIISICRSRNHRPYVFPSCCRKWTLIRSIKSLGSKTRFGGLNLNKFGRLLNSTTTLSSPIRLKRISIALAQQYQKIICTTLCGYPTTIILRSESSCEIGTGRLRMNSTTALYAASAPTPKIFLSNK